MRRIYVVLLVMAMGFVMVSPVGAAKPDCTADPTHPSCKDDDEPLGGTTCAEWLGVPEDLKTGDFDITLRGKNASACVDVMAIQGSWTVGIDIESGEGTVRFLRLLPRDSIAPGDSCGGFEFRRNIPESVVLPGPDHPLDLDGDGMIEGAYVNSCGTQFGELVGGFYYDKVREDIPSPLAFQIDMAGRENAVVTLHVDLPSP